MRMSTVDTIDRLTGLPLQRRRAPHPPGGPCLERVSGAPLTSVLGAAVASIGAPLLHQQCWCWGWDIRDLDGNVLLAHGFTRHRTPAVRDSTYTLDLPNGRTVVLWGWGVFYGDPACGGLILQRCGFDPLLTRSAEAPRTVSSVNELPALASPDGADAWHRVGQLLPPLLRWIAAYEVWVRTERGEAYRRLSLRACPRLVIPRPVAAGRLVETWNSLADRCAAISQERAGLQRARGGRA